MAQDVLSEVFNADFFTVTVALITFYVAVLVINKLTGLIIFLLKKLVLLFIVSLAFYHFLMQLMARVAEQGWTQDNLMAGVVGFFVGFVSLIIALYAAFSSLTHIRGESNKEETVKEKKEEKGEKPLQSSITDIFSMQTLKDDRTLGAVLAYLIVAQFGVFSSKTISAPTEMVGLGFFIVFMVAAFFFVLQGYRNKSLGLQHLAVASVTGFILSILLGHFWGNFPIEQLLSLGYFATDSLVAFVTGIALSLFMGSRG